MTNTSKTAALALAAIVAAGAVATPVFADSKKFDDAFYLQQLRYDGINAIAVDQVTTDTFRATVLLDGHTVFEFFDNATLQQLK